MSGCLSAPAPVGMPEGRALPRLSPLGSVKPWQTLVTHPIILAPRLRLWNAFHWSPRTSGMHRQGQAWEGHAHLCSVLSRFPSQPTREKKVCLLLCVWVFLGLRLRISSLWSKGYRSRVSPFVVVSVCGEGKWGVMVFVMECPPRPCRFPLPGLVPLTPVGRDCQRMSG